MLFSFLFLVAAAPARSTENPLFKVAVLPFQPFGFEENGQATGIFTDIMQEASRRMGKEIDLRILPLQRLIHTMRSGKISCSIFFLVPRTMEWFEPIAPLGKKIRTVVFFKPQLSITSVDDLAQYNLAMPLGFRVEDIIQRKEKLPRKQYSDTYTQIVQMLRAGRVDAVTGSYAGLRYGFRKAGIDVSAYPKPLEIKSHDLNLVCKKDMLNQSQKREIQRIFASMREDGYIDKTWDAYLYGR